MSNRMQGKVALISGAARGQGAAHARRLAAEGAAVLCTDILDDLGEEVAAGIRDKGGDAEYRRLDVRSSADWSSAVGYVEERWRQLNVLVNNAGIVELADAAECSDSEWDEVIGVCQTGTFRGTRAAIPALRRAGGGSIVNISSIQGIRGAWGYVAYQAAKSAVLGITRSTAKTFGADGIRANAVCPGIVDTPMLTREIEQFSANPYFDFEKDYLAFVPLGKRAAQPEEIADVVLHLASDESSYTTGMEYVVDGGWGV